MSFNALNDAHVRLAILRLLQEAQSANDSILCQSVQALGLHSTRDQMRGHLGWLEEQRAVTLLRPRETVIVAALTERGDDLASGRSTIPGVQRPTPGAGI